MRCKSQTKLSVLANTLPNARTKIAIRNVLGSPILAGWHISPLQLGTQKAHQLSGKDDSSDPASALPRVHSWRAAVGLRPPPTGASAGLHHRLTVRAPRLADRTLQINDRIASRMPRLRTRQRPIRAWPERGLYPPLPHLGVLRCRPPLASRSHRPIGLAHGDKWARKHIVKG